MATINPNEDFDVEAAAQALKESMKGLGTSEEELILALVLMDNAQRQEAREFYKQSFGKDLIDDLKDELGGNFEDGVLALMAPPRLYDARQLRKAMKGAGTDEATLIEIMCARSNAEIAEITTTYGEEYDGRSLEEDIENDTSGYFKRLLVSQSTGGREEGDEADTDRAAEDAQRIYDAGEGQFGTDESEINSVLATRSYAQLRATFDAYEGIAGRTIEEAIDSECSGTLQDGFTAVVKFARDPLEFYATRLYNSMKGAGTDDDTLIRLVVGRSEIDLEDIKEVFYGKYEKSLYEFIADDCGGDYKRLLLGIIARKS